MKRIVLISVLLSMAAMLHSQNLTRVVSGSIHRIENFKSKFIDTRNVDVWLPDGYSNSKKYAVVYMHDGQMLFDSLTTWNHRSWDADAVISQLIRDNQIEPVIVVGIWNSGKSRHPEFFPQKPFESLTPELKALATKQLQSMGNTIEKFQPHSDNYLKFLVTELKPFIDKNYSVYKDRRHTFIVGSSMGGLISMYAICEYPKIFGGAICMSTHWPGSFTVENNPIPESFFIYLKSSLPDPRKHKIYFDYGDKTLDAMYPPLQQKADEVMKAKGYTNKNWITRFYPGDDHSETAWSRRLHVPLEFLLKK